MFDAVTISFGLRNVADPGVALAEMLRVTRPGGRLVVCEFSHPTLAPFRTVYLEYLMKALPAVARAVSSSPDAYVYLAESIRAWPDQQGLAAVLQARLGNARVRQVFQPEILKHCRGHIELPFAAVNEDDLRKRLFFRQHPFITAKYCLMH